jgi:hypothetical protein
MGIFVKTNDCCFMGKQETGRFLRDEPFLPNGGCAG